MERRREGSLRGGGGEGAENRKEHVNLHVQTNMTYNILNNTQMVQREATQVVVVPVVEGDVGRVADNGVYGVHDVGGDKKNSGSSATAFVEGVRLSELEGEDGWRGGRGGGGAERGGGGGARERKRGKRRRS